MLRLLWMAGSFALGVLPALADTVTLQGDAALTGRILAEKPDHVVMDVGYTVLMVPRAQILEVSRTNGADAASAEPAPQETAETHASPGGFYSTNGGQARPRMVRELVGILGEAVVQVRTPGGLGSGFLINPEGFLITNFHVIEGETQISVEVYWQTDGQLERKTYKQVRIVAMNKFKDLALLKIEEDDAPPSSSSGSVRRMIWLWASGCLPSAVRWDWNAPSPRAS